MTVLRFPFTDAEGTREYEVDMAAILTIEDALTVEHGSYVRLVLNRPDTESGWEAVELYGENADAFLKVFNEAEGIRDPVLGEG